MSGPVAPLPPRPAGGTAQAGSFHNQFGVPVHAGWTVAAALGGLLAIGALLVLTLAGLSRTSVAVAVVLGGLALLAAVPAWLRTAESRRQTAIVRAAFGYRRGERPWTSKEHRKQLVIQAVLVALAALSLWNGGTVVHGYLLIFWIALFGTTALSALQKRRHESAPQGWLPRPPDSAPPRWGWHRLPTAPLQPQRPLPPRPGRRP
ncbi:MAG TPA: hypothetical protein VGE77_00680 [Nocardioides sp.]